MTMHVPTIVIAAVAGLAWGACSAPTMPSNIRLEGRDTIVEFGRSAFCSPVRPHVIGR